jgi:hypothetical protein
MSGAAAAAAQARRKREEEEEMTLYTRDDLAEDWEFKILRSMSGAFKNPETLKRVLDEESRAGWLLVEKFDNQRIRLKRPANAKKVAPDVGFDPYRTYYGVSEGQFALIVAACTVGTMIAVAALVALAVALS